jgi:hypothetical protein
MKTPLEWAEELRGCMQADTVWCELEMSCAMRFIVQVRAELLDEIGARLKQLSEDGGY